MTTTICIDTGGTFTDGFVVHDGTPHVVKVMTTPHDLEVCFRDVIDAAAAAIGIDVPTMLRDTESVRYATTVGTNAVLQRRGPKLGLLTDAPSVNGDAGKSGVGVFVDAEMVAQVDGEIPSAAMRDLLERGARGLVSSLSDASRERAVRDLFEDTYPPHCLDAVPLVLGRDVVGDASLTRRTATALFNAYVHPDVADFLYRAEDYLRANGYRRPLLIVHNDGSCSRVAKTVAGKTYNSGPTGGLLGARAISSLYDGRPLVSFDMGGTSLDVAVVGPDDIPMREPGVVEDVEIGLALPDLLPLGAGGGSIASVSDDGVLRVGPQSAGAYPGPACFGRGGSEPTVTDADVVLGILRPEAFLGGRIKLDADAAAAAMRPIGERLGVETDDVAERILQTVNAEMGARLADIARARDVDPAQATILAFGGNGATHAAGIAEQAGIREVMVLPIAAVFSAFGASTATIRHARQAPSSDGDEVALRELVLRDMRSEGFTADEVQVAVREDEHAGERWLVAEAVRQAAPVEMPRDEASSEPARPAGHAEVRWPGAGRITTELYTREDLRPGATLAGPALVEAPETTCAVPPGWTARLDERGALCLTHEEVGS
jgi:N-methylhydantoinase A/oxoprolinase/acetone carboxylase beta subunit